jgi:hypothetical protein
LLLIDWPTLKVVADIFANAGDSANGTSSTGEVPVAFATVMASKAEDHNMNTKEARWY